MAHIYLDHNATTTIRPAVIDLVRDVMAGTGNASSVHAAGRTASARVEKARAQVAQLAGSQPEYVIFNSGATEANNSVFSAFKGETVMISAIEHPSVREAAPDAVRFPVTADGVIDLQVFEALVKEHKPALISCMLVNSETGVIQPVAELARIARKAHADVFIHTDAVQAAGKIKIDMPALQVDYLSLSAHKCGGPQGVGALICAPGARPAKFLHGGGQEKSRRAGTENVAGIAGFGLAAELALAGLAAYQDFAALRDKLETGLAAIHGDVKIFGQDAPRVANTCGFACAGLPAQTQLMALDLDGIAVSTGSACSSGSVKKSHALSAMGASDAELDSALRVSLGWNTEEQDIDALLNSWKKIVGRMQKKNGEGAAA